MEKVSKKIYTASLILAILSIGCTLLIGSLQRDFFYFSFYAAVIGLFLERRFVKNYKINNIMYSLIFIGVIKILWTILLYYNLPKFGFGWLQLDAGKKLVVGGVIIFYLTNFSGGYSKEQYKIALLVGFSIAFVFATIFGLIQMYNGIPRIELSTNRATITAYIYSMLSIITIYLLINRVSISISYFYFSVLVSVLSFVIITMTGTRAAILAHPIIIIIMLLFKFRTFNMRTVIVASIIIPVSILLSYNKFISPKVEQTRNEIMLYNKGDDFSSLGSRFSLWKVGFEIFKIHPFGNTVEARHKQAENVIIFKPENKTAMVYIDSHLHNELLESASLQGVAGLLAVLFFYYAIISHAIKNINTPLLIIGLCMIAYGLSDVLLISSEVLMFFMLCTALFTKHN